MKKNKTKQNKTNEGTSHHMMFWTPEYCTCYKAPLLKKKKKKKKKKKQKKKKKKKKKKKTNKRNKERVGDKYGYRQR